MTQRDRGQGLKDRRHSSHRRSWQGLDENRIGHLSAETQSSVANLANEPGFAGYQLDFLVLNETQLPQTLGQLRARGELFDAHNSSRLYPAQGAKFGAGTMSFNYHKRLGGSLFHRGAT